MNNYLALFEFIGGYTSAAPQAINFVARDWQAATDLAAHAAQIMNEAVLGYNLAEVQGWTVFSVELIGGAA